MPKVCAGVETHTNIIAECSMDCIFAVIMLKYYCTTSFNLCSICSFCYSSLKCVILQVECKGHVCMCLQKKLQQQRQQQQNLPPVPQLVSDNYSQCKPMGFYITAELINIIFSCTPFPSFLQFHFIHNK